ncbi:hypothetical protein ABLV49_24045 (plasmid) [Polaromonas hydrogenivorans]|uniref:Uncharacterized protein n=1 Tax=Polaromonas hydrogenivorans TaxID=335476 RepID=A0AAU7LZV2_9BURK
MLRLYRAGIGPGWFAQADIGANWISPKYRNDTRVFSRMYNFGDRIGIGHRKKRVCRRAFQACQQANI